MKANDKTGAYRARMSRKGGAKSRRILSSEDARNIVRIREAQRAFDRYYAQCFWYLRSDMKVTISDIPEIVRGLRQNGGRAGYMLAERLCQ